MAHPASGTRPPLLNVRGLLEKTTMQPESPAPKPRRYRHLVRCILVVVIAMLGWYSWKGYDFGRATRQAKELGWNFTNSDPFAKIREDWKNAFRKETWRYTGRVVFLPNCDQLTAHVDVIRRLKPDVVVIDATIPPSNLSALKELPDPFALLFEHCTKLPNLGALKDMKSLSVLMISASPDLKNIDALKDLTGLTHLTLLNCNAVPDVDALRELKGLKHLSLAGCSELKNVDGILGLTGLNHLFIFGCGGLEKGTMDTVRAALPTTKISSPGAK